MEETSLCIPLIDNKAECPICLYAVCNVSLPGCSHNFCRNCVNQYLELKISEAQVLRINCPVTGCPIQLEPAFIQVIVNPEYFEKYSNFYAKKQLESSIYFRWCPNKSCEGYDTFNSSNKLTCNLCDYKYCFLCAEPWHDGACKETDDKGFKFWAKRKVKTCPNCKLRTEKNGGCTHMTCTKCGSYWCWICNQSMDDHSHSQCMFANNGFDEIWFLSICLIFSPVTLPFFVPLLMMSAMLFEQPETNNDRISRFVMKHKILSFILGTIISPIMASLVLGFGLIALIGVSIAFASSITPFKNSQNLLLGFFLMVYILTFASVIFCVVAAIAVIGFVAMPLIGIGLLCIKLYYLIAK